MTTPAAPNDVAGPEPPASPERARYGQVLGVAEFRVIFAANIVSMLGSVVAAVALTVLVYQQTRSPALAASVMALSFLPYLVGGVLFGAAADRLPPRRVLVTCDLASAALVGCMVIPAMPLPALLGLLFVTGLISPVYQGVRSAVMPDVLPPGPDYILGRSLMRMVAQGAQVAGYGAGGLLLAVVLAARRAGRGRGVLRGVRAWCSGSGMARRPAAGGRAGIDGARLARRAAGRARAPGQPGGCCCSAGSSRPARSRPRRWRRRTRRTSASRPGSRASC